MKILRREPECANLELELSSQRGGQDRQLRLDGDGCERVLKEIKVATLLAINEIMKSKSRLTWEKNNRSKEPEQFDGNMDLTRDRIELEKSELALILDQLDAVWERIPQELRPAYQNRVDEIRKALKIQIDSSEVPAPVQLEE